MPPRSYYNEPRPSDYLAFARAFFPMDLGRAVDFINRYELPFIENELHLAGYLGVSSSLIRQILHQPAYHYRTFPVSKPDGSERIISTPRSYLKVIQWWISDNVLINVPITDSVHGFRKHRSYISNAQAHQSSRHILNVDVQSFFDSIDEARIFQVFEELGYSEEGSRLLSMLTAKNGVAPTGAPTSPMIANAVFHKIDVQLATLAADNGLTYTRYADDLTFSAMTRIDSNILTAVGTIVESGGFCLNPNKSKFMGPGDRMEVTGVVVNAGLNASKEWRNAARGFIHRIAKNPDEYVSQIARVHGIFGILLQFDADKTKRLTRSAEEAVRLLIEARRAALHKNTSD